ncbi:MAG: GspH/FimT family pseudopilin [Gammaproteobacteria bacterium]
MLRPGGFTLIELIVVLAIAGLLVALVPPLFSKVLGGVELRATARELAAALRYARSRAVFQQRDALLTLDTEQRRYRVSGRKGVGRIDRDIELKMLAARSQQTGRARASIRFFPDGSTTGGQISLSDGGSRYVIDVNWLTGRVALYR